MALRRGIRAIARSLMGQHQALLGRRPRPVDPGQPDPRGRGRGERPPGVDHRDDRGDQAENEVPVPDGY